MNVCDCVPIKLHLQKQSEGQDLAGGLYVLISHLDHFYINKIHLPKGKQYREMSVIRSKREEVFQEKG